jgi:hypothetical protein
MSILRVQHVVLPVSSDAEQGPCEDESVCHGMKTNARAKPPSTFAELTPQPAMNGINAREIIGFTDGIAA